MVGKLLGIGVKALHTRCEQLFGCKWAAFLGQQCSSSAALSSPTASSQPSADGEEEPRRTLCPAAAAASPSVTAEAPAAAAAAQPSAATAATLEPLLEPCLLMACQDYDDEELCDVINLLRGPSLRGADPAAAAATAAQTATTSCGCCATGVCGCEELESVYSAGQQQRLQLAASAAEADVLEMTIATM